MPHTVRSHDHEMRVTIGIYDIDFWFDVRKQGWDSDLDSEFDSGQIGKGGRTKWSGINIVNFREMNI